MSVPERRELAPVASVTAFICVVPYPAASDDSTVLRLSVKGVPALLMRLFAMTDAEN